MQIRLICSQASCIICQKFDKSLNNDNKTKNKDSSKKKNNKKGTKKNS